MESPLSSRTPCDCSSPPPLDSDGEKQKLTCCDESCLDEIARRECSAQSCCNDKPMSDHDASEKPDSNSKNGETRDTTSRPCQKHIRTTRERYGSTLEALGCICRALLARNLETCCSTKRPSPNRSRPSTPTSLHTRFANSASCATRKGQTSQNDGCCASGSNRLDRRSCDRKRSAKSAVCSTEDCCKGDQAACSDTEPPNIVAVAGPSGVDIEKGNLAPEHVVLTVQGLTCVGCENKLFRSLDSIPSVYKVKTSLVLSQAEFDLDLNAASVEEVIATVERTTGFNCERLTGKDQHLDVVVVGTAADFITNPYPMGVHDMVALDKHTVRITYNASLIGARNLLESSFETSIRLAPLRPPPALEAGNNHVRKTAYMTLLSAILTVPVLVLAWAPLPKHDITYGAVSLALATLVQCIVAGPFYPSAFKSLVFTRVIEMDLLIVLSTTTAYVFSVVAFAYQVKVQPLLAEGFFQTSTLLVTLIMLGRYTSALARQKAVESISIRSLQVQTALLSNADGSEAREIDARLLQYGDVFKVSPDSRIVTDGVVISGITEVDESMVTGEATLVEKRIGSSVIAGSVNGSGILVVQLTNLPGDNTISNIANMVDEAKFSKPRTQEIADRFAGYFVPIVLALTLITFGVWIAVAIVARKESSASAVVEALTYAVSVLIVSCPCAIGLAVPMVIVIAGGVAAKRGVIFKSAETVEIARNVSHVVFDKTGTLTQGQLMVVAEEYFSESRETIISAVLGLTSNIKHPVSSTIMKHLQRLGIEPTPLESITSVTGSGIEGKLNGVHVRGGNPRWLNVDHSLPVQSLSSRGLTVFCVSIDDQLLAAFGLEDSIRPDAIGVISKLKKRGIVVSVVSGDNDGAVQMVAAKVGVSSLFVRSDCNPRQKQQYVKELVENDGKVVLFCGDGTNDAPALAQATIGVHMNEGTDVAKSAADAVLIRPSLSGILLLIDLSRASYRRIMFNFTWAFVYNILAILLAAGAFVHARIPPQYAGLVEIVSVLPVILIALQLRWFNVG